MKIISKNRRNVNTITFSIDSIVAQKKSAQQPCGERFTRLYKPCKACGYENGNVIMLLGQQAAIKCGKCDTYQYSVNLKSKKGGLH